MRAKIVIGIGAVSLLVSSAVASMIGSDHDLSSTSGVGDNEEVCIYCHTPHASNAEFVGAPLWNKPTTGTTFTMYGATEQGVPGQTIAGTQTDAAPTGASLACLSCHDGVSAMNSVVNAAGSGGYDIDGTIIGSPNYLPASMGNQIRAVGYGGDLTNDHPISIPYEPGRASLKPIDTPISNWNNASTIADLLKNGKVQCTSCHDPHYPYYGRFLRTGNDDSKLCKTCHEK